MKIPLSNSQTASLVLAKAASWSQPLRHARMWCGGRGVARAFVAICVVTVGTHKTPCFLLWPCHVNSISTFKTWLTDCSVIWLRVPRPGNPFLVFTLLKHVVFEWSKSVGLPASPVTLRRNRKLKKNAGPSQYAKNVEGLCHTRILLSNFNSAVLNSLLSV